MACLGPVHRNLKRSCCTERDCTELSKERVLSPVHTRRSKQHAVCLQVTDASEGPRCLQEAPSGERSCAGAGMVLKGFSEVVCFRRRKGTTASLAWCHLLTLRLYGDSLHRTLWVRTRAVRVAEHSAASGVGCTMWESTLALQSPRWVDVLCVPALENVKDVVIWGRGRVSEVEKSAREKV